MKAEPVKEGKPQNTGALPASERLNSKPPATVTGSRKQDDLKTVTTALIDILIDTREFKPVNCRRLCRLRDHTQENTVARDLI